MCAEHCVVPRSPLAGPRNDFCLIKLFFISDEACMSYFNQPFSEQRLM